MTTRKRATRIATASSIFEIWRFMTKLILKTPALCDKDPRGTPLKEEDDHRQHEDLSKHRIEKDLLQRLIDNPDPERADDRADDITDAPDHDSHEAIDDITLAQAGTDIADLRKERSREAREAAPQSESEHVHALGFHAHARGHLAVLHDCANEQAKRRPGKNEVRADDDDDGKADHENAVPAEDDIVDGPVTAQPARAVNLNVVGSEYETEELL